MNPGPLPAASRLYLTGFMGSGKSTVGPLLARNLGYEFIDLDTTIEDRTGNSVPGIFRERGEKEFRAMETRELRLLSARESIVVATGGGALADSESFAVIRNAGVLIYLRVSPETLFTRLQGMRGRPMIAAPDGTPLGDEALRERIASLLAEREALYLRADIIVDADTHAADVTVSSIIAALRSNPPA